MREGNLPRISFAVRLLCMCFGGLLVFFWFVVSGGIDNSNDPAWHMWAPLLIVWALGTAWVLAGKANEVNGWGELYLSEVIFISLLTLVLVVGSFFMLLVFSFAGMH